MTWEQTVIRSRICRISQGAGAVPRVSAAVDADCYDRLVKGKGADFCVIGGIRYFDSYDLFRREDPKELNVTEMDYHTNQCANRIATNAIAEYLRRTSKLF